MTVLESINKKLVKAKVISIIGAHVFGIGVIISMFSEASTTSNLIIYAGIVVVSLGIFFGLNFVSCPRCGHNLGKDAFMHSNIGFKLKKNMNKCPYCSLLLNEAGIS